MEKVLFLDSLMNMVQHASKKSLALGLWTKRLVSIGQLVLMTTD